MLTTTAQTPAKNTDDLTESIDMADSSDEQAVRKGAVRTGRRYRKALLDKH